MKNLKIVLVALLLMLLTQASQAVDIQAGWYACYDSICLEGFNFDTGGIYATFWRPSSELGESGAITVSDWQLYPSTRKITITENISVDSGTILFEDTGFIEDPSKYYQLTHIVWRTDYDANNIRMQLLRHRDGQDDKLIWEQAQSGLNGGYDILSDNLFMPGDSLVIRLVVVPEPSAFLSLSVGLAACFPLIKYRRREQK